MNTETIIKTKCYELCNEDFNDEIHYADLAKKNRRKEGKVFCPHPDCKGKLGFINTNKMAYHFQAIHHIKYSDWLCEKVLKEEYNGIWPLCKCGCGEKVPFQKLKFSEYCKGHHHKGKQFGQQARQNMSEGSREWQNNLTKEEKYEMHKKSGETNKSNKQKIRDEVRQKVINEKYNGIVPRCPVCGHELEFVFKWRDFRKFCSVKCINTGRKETFEHRTKISINTQRSIFEKFGVNTVFKLPHIMKRKKTSKTERRLSEILGAHLGFKLENKSYDMIKGNTIIEVEGLFFHPAKLENLTMIQANNAVNDFSKKEIAKNHPEYEFLKIREDKVKDIQKVSIDYIRENTYEQDFRIHDHNQLLMSKNYFESLKADTKAEKKINYCILICLKFIRQFLPEFLEIDDDILVSALISLIGDNDKSKDFTIKNLRELISVDQFFTKKDVAKNIVETLREILDLSFYEHIIEPSAGNGSISLLLENCEAYDIFPQHHSIKRADFFDLRFDYKVEKTLIVGNPPFGRQSSLALKFIKKSCEIADTVAFILPRSFKKDSVRDKVPLTHSCIFEFDLNPNSFEKDGISRSIQCVFQIWIRKDREKSEKYFSKDFSFCSKDDAHFSFRRAGGLNVGEISADFLHKSESSHYFIKTKNANVIETLKLIDWKTIGSNTIAVKSVSKNEIYKAYMEKINENDKTRDKS